MLEFLRKRAQSIVIQAIVVIIVLVFIFWGVGTNLMNKQEAAIVVDKEEISFQDFQRAYDQAYNRFAEQFGGTVPKGLAETFNIKQQVINQLIQESLLRQGGLEMGLMVSSQEIQNEVENMVQFQQDGTFSMERYKTILASNRLSPEKYEQSLRYELLGAKTVRNISAFSQVASDYEIEELYNLEKETVSVSYVVFTSQSYVDGVEVTDDGLQQWYEAHGDSYKTEKEVKVRYLPFLYSDIGTKITIGDDELKKYYDEHISDYQTPEKRHARHILLKASPDDSEEIHQQQKAKAQEILEKAKSGEDFAQLAQQYSEGPTAATGGDLGFFAENQMVKPFSDAVFAMNSNEISDIVKTDFGYHIIKLEEIQPAHITSFDDAKADIIKKLQLEQAQPLAFQMANTAYEAIIGAGSLDAYLKEQPDTTVIDTDFFSQSAPPEGITADQAFLEKAFELNEKELSSIVETGDGYVIISATAVKEPQVPALDDVRERVEKDYRAEKASEQALADAEQMITDLGTDGSKLADLAASKDLTVQESGPLMKNDPEPKSSFPQTLAPDAFMLSRAAPISAVPGQVGQDYYVYRLDERTPPQAALSEEDRARYRALLLQMKQQRIVDAWLRNRQANAHISIHKSLENF
jgi:peptidyl-prolyl cis-trans isomerase D